MTELQKDGSDWKFNSLGLLLSIMLAIACLFLYIEHQHLDTICRLTGEHEEVFGEDVQTPRQAIDSICSGMPSSPEQPEH